jgi:hypothetical protein
VEKGCSGCVVPGMKVEGKDKKGSGGRKNYARVAGL